MQNKNNIWIGLGLLVLIILIVAGIYLVIPRGEVSNEKSIFATLPSVSLTSSPSSTSVLTPVSTYTGPSHNYVIGSVWQVVSIENNALHQNGYVYDVATFVLVGQPTVTLRAHCAQPQWPDPEIGHRYMILNSRGVMIPEEGVTSKLQRFLILDGDT